MNTYTNLPEYVINITTQFFTELDINNSGYILVREILEKLQSKNKPAMTRIPVWLQTFISDNQLNETSEITLASYENYQTQLSSFNINFDTIDTDANGVINLNDLYIFYSEHFVAQTNDSYTWFQDIVTNENLNLETPLSLDQLLTYENKYNTTHTWF